MNTQALHTSNMSISAIFPKDTGRRPRLYLSPHDRNLLMELAPVKTRIFLQNKGKRSDLCEYLIEIHFLL